MHRLTYKNVHRQVDIALCGDMILAGGIL